MMVASQPSVPEVPVESDHELPVVACSLEPGNRTLRAAQWRALTARSLEHAGPTDRGVRLVFEAGPGVTEELSSLADLERECCAFAAWSVRPSGGQLILEVTGDSQEAATAIQAMFLTDTGQNDSPPA
jgi:hypothetical protein